MSVDSAQSCVEFCLRQLGAPVINIEVDDEQLTDCLDMAVQFYHEQHYDGVERDYVKVEITSYDMDQGYIELDDTSIFSVLRVLKKATTANSSNMFFNLEYQLLAGEMRNITSNGISYYNSVKNYLAELDFMFQREKSFRFNRRMNRLYLDVNWGSDLSEGDNLVFEVYRSVDPESFPEVYNDRWFKKYLTALIKKQWGTNLSKYDGLSLPGGVTMNGKYVLEQAMGEIEKLEQEALDTGAPLGFMIG